MKRRCMSMALVKGTVFIIAAVMFLSAGAAAAAAGLSPELKTLIQDRIDGPSERGLVLESSARAVGSGFPEDHLYAIVERALDAKVSGEGLSRMIQFLTDARRKGIPTQSYSGKIVEGLAKRVSEERIIRALEKVQERMEFAASLAEPIEKDGKEREELIVRTADAVAAGMGRRELQVVYNSMERDRVNQTIAPEDIMEMVKAASGYGLDSKKVGDFAVSLMTDSKADQGDIRRFLGGLAGEGYRGRSDEKPESKVEKDMESDGSGHDADDDDDSAAEEDGSGGHEAGGEESDDHEAGDDESDDRESERD